MPVYDEEPLLEAHGRDGVYAMDVDDGEAPPPRRYLYAPISYDQAMRPQRPWWHPLEWYNTVREHAHVFDVLRPSEGVKSGWQRTQRILMAAWPQNRMHQTIVIVFGLWLLVSYASFTVEETLPIEAMDDRLFNGYYEIVHEELKGVYMHPDPQAGHVAMNTSWGGPQCYSRGKPLRMYDAVECRNTVSFTLEALPADNSMISSDTSFLYIDRGRTALHTNPGVPDLLPEGDSLPHENAVPANVYIVTHDLPPNTSEDKALIHVNVTASYYSPARLLLERSLVVKMQRGHGSQGVQIITPPMSKHAHPHEVPLEFDVVVSVPKSTIAGLEIEAPNANVHVFTDYAIKCAMGKGHALDRIPSLIDQLLGKKPEKTEPNGPVKKESLEHHFGHVAIKTEVGSIEVADTIHANGMVQLATADGKIDVEGRLNASTVKLTTDAGLLTLTSGAQVQGDTDTLLSSKTGVISLEHNTHVSGAKTIGRTGGTGSIVGSGTWHANFSLDLATEAGLLNASVAVHRPVLEFVPYNDFRATANGRRVTGTYTSVNGTVYVAYVEHQSGVALDSRATSQRGSVSVLHAPTYEGPVTAQGAQAAIEHGAFTQGHHFDTKGETSAGGRQVRNATVYWDAARRPPVAPSLPNYPPPLEADQSVLSFQPQSLATSLEKKAYVYLSA